MQVESIDLRSINDADARAIARLFVLIWPKPGRTVDTMTASLLEQWHEYTGPEAQHPRAFVIRENGGVIAHAAGYPRTIGTECGDLTLLALARVCTDPVARGRKLGETVTKATFRLVDEGMFPVSLFQTMPAVAPFYVRLGAVPVTNKFVSSLAADRKASPFWDPIIMRYPARADWPAGRIDLRGPGW